VGARVSGTLAVTPGQTLFVEVGGAGQGNGSGDAPDPAGSGGGADGLGDPPPATIKLPAMASRDLFANFDRMRREMDQLFGDILSRSRIGGGGFTPPIDVLYLDSPPRAVIKAELAGVDAAELALEISGREVIIAGRRRFVEPGGAAFQQIEIEQGPFRRVIRLTADVRAEEASAVYEDGILRLELPLAVQQQGVRTVPIETESESEQTSGST
jgi:HSP20 family protein